MPIATEPPTRPGRPLDHLDVGAGPVLLLMQGFAMQPRTYLRLAERLADRCRVVIPALFAEPGLTWSPAQVLRDVIATLDHLDIERASILGHSFGGALELDLAVEHPERVTELVFADTLAMSREWTLAAEAVHPMHLIWMATPRAALDFASSALHHPLCLARAGWWGFRSDRRRQVAELAASTIPRHVLWANRDSLLARNDGASFARDMHASFTVVQRPDGRALDHDWLYRYPDVAEAQLTGLDLALFGGAGDDRGSTTPGAAPHAVGR